MNNNYNKQKKYNPNNNRNKQSTYNYPIINQPLSKEYVDYKKLYLPDGHAYKYACDFKGISNSQLRKILNDVKIALYQIDDGFEKAQSKMFVLVAMTAYNYGRNKKKNKENSFEPLYVFIKNTINEKSITSVEDIKAFDQMFTSIVAYHKTMSRD